MIRRPFLAFSLVISILITGVLWFIQSPQFAVVIKAVISQYLPKDMGIEGDFSELSVKLFPPGISVRNPKVWLREHNIAQLPAGSHVEAERIDVTFRPFQIVSGDIRVHEVAVVNGQLHLIFNRLSEKKKNQKKPSSQDAKFHWDDLLHIRTEGVALENVQVNLQLEGEQESIQARAEHVSLSQTTGKGGVGYSIALKLKQINGSVPSLLSQPIQMDQLEAKAFVNMLGIRVDSVFAASPALELSAHGFLKGNLLSLSKELNADLKILAKGDIQKTLEVVQAKKSKVPLQGKYSFEGEVKGNVLNAMETLKAQGNLSVKQASIQQWKADLIQVEASWEASPKGGVVSLKKAVISSKVLPRQGGFQIGQGGTIEIGPADWSIGSTDAISAPVKFEHVHIHWLAGPGFKVIYPLDFRFNGRTNLSFIPPAHHRGWELHAELDNWIEDFRLDNQKYQVNRPITVIFQVPKIKLQGPVSVDETGVRPSQLVLSLPNTQVIADGEINFKKGYDLHAQGDITLDDLNQIAENKIKGRGTVNALIHGPIKAVIADIDLNLKQAEYLKLFLGDLKGRITWDDDHDQLIFGHTDLKYQDTPYTLEGSINVGAKERISLDAKVVEGNIQDFIQIFRNLTSDLSWFPNQLNGPFAGDIKVRGELSFPKLKVLAEINGTDWELYGERFKSVQLAGGYDRGTYALDEFFATKKTGIIDGEISLDPYQYLRWEVKTKNFMVSELDHVAKSDVPFRGVLDIHSTGFGKIGTLTSTTDTTLTGCSVRGVAMPASAVSLKTQSGRTHLSGSILGGQGVVDSIFDSNPKGRNQVQAEFRQLDFSPILLLLNKKAMQDRALAGNISGLVDLNFESGDLAKASGVVRVNDYLLACSDAKFQLENPVSVAFVNGNFDVNQMAIIGQQGRISVALSSMNSNLSGQVSGELDNSLVKFFTSAISRITGNSLVNLKIKGTSTEPLMGGTIKLNGGHLTAESFESPFENLQGTLLVDQNKLMVQDFQAELGGGQIGFGGEIVINSDKTPSISLKGSLKETKIKVYPFQYAKLNGTLGVQGESAPYTVEGNLVVDSALSKEKVLNQKRTGEGFKAIQYLPLPTKQGEGGASLFKLNIAIEAPKGVLVQNDLFRDVEAKGKMTLVNTLDTPRVLGKAEVLQGKLIFKDHVFQIQSASAVFDSPTVINPSFDLVANTEANGVKIQMYATGRKDNIKIEVSSNPAMAESDIFSLLALGLTSNDAKKLNASDLSLIQQGEAASLVLHSLDFNRDLEDKTGFQVRVDESVNKQQGVSAFRPQSQNETSAAPQITIRRKLGDRLGISAGSTVGFGSNKSNQINLDYTVSPGLSVIGVFNTYGSSGINTGSTGATGAYGATDAQSSQTIFSTGIDFKFQKRFK